MSRCEKLLRRKLQKYKTSYLSAFTKCAKYMILLIINQRWDLLQNNFSFCNKIMYVHTESAFGLNAEISYEINFIYNEINYKYVIFI